MEDKIVYGRVDAYHPDHLQPALAGLAEIGVANPEAMTVVIFHELYIPFTVPPSPSLAVAVRKIVNKQPTAIFYRTQNNNYGSLLVDRNGIARPEGIIPQPGEDMPAEVWEAQLSFWRAYFDDTHTLN